jgi:hypothetical protein
MTAATTVPGTCLCGTVRFEVALPTLFCAHCHCSLCRRQHGAAFVTWFGVPRGGLAIREGESVLVRHRSSDHGTRSFCGRCGSPLFCELDAHPDQIDVVLASMTAPIDKQPQMHCFYSDRVPWVTVGDGLPHLGGKSGLEPLEE